MGVFDKLTTFNMPLHEGWVCFFQLVCFRSKA